MPAAVMVHEEDPANKIWRHAGNLDEIDVFNSNVLIGVYLRPDEGKTKGGILITYKTTDEDRYQSKTGIILKMGPAAFKDPDGVWFADETIDVGDWVVARASDGLGMKLLSIDPKTGEKNELLCRLVEDTSIRMRIRASAPADRIY